MKEIPLQRVRELFYISSETGIIKLKSKRGGSSRNSGVTVGTEDSKGHLQIKIDGTLYMAHRLCYAHYNNLRIFGEIDHKDRNKKNNSIDNLRVVSRKENIVNAGARNNNSVGAKNITKEGHKFRVDINKKYIGSYYSLHEAVNVANKIRYEEYGDCAFFEDTANIEEIDNTPVFSIAGHKHSEIENIVKLSKEDAMSKYKISKSSYYRMKKYVVRYAETSIAIPDDVRVKREQARSIL